jgi:hypothetical protein
VPDVRPMLGSGMPKRSSKPKPDDEDTNVMAHRILREATGEAEPTTPPEPTKNPAAVALGRLGGLKGGAARAAKLSKKRRADIAKKAARARWSA